MNEGASFRFRASLESEVDVSKMVQVSPIIQLEMCRNFDRLNQTFLWLEYDSGWEGERRVEMMGARAVAAAERP